VTSVPDAVLYQIRAAIDTGAYGISPHVAARASEKGFAIRDALRVARWGQALEWYPDRERVLIGGQIDIGGTPM
jgi:hypothetical protein